MAYPSVAASGTTTPASLSVAETLATITTVGTFLLVADLAAIVNGETLILRLYYKCLSGGTERLAYSAVYQHAQGEPMKFSVPVPSDISLKATIEQQGGTLRAIPWKMLQIAG